MMRARQAGLATLVSSAALALLLAASATPMPVDCPNPEGGSCLGQLRAGRYHTVRFAPPLTYRVPAAWQNFEDTPGNFLLVPPDQELAGVNAGTSDFIGVYTAVAAAAQNCVDRPARGVARTPSAIARWIVRLPGAKAGAARPTEIGGLRGVVLDVSMRRGWKKSCPYPELGGTPFIALIHGVRPTSLLHGLIPGLAFRLYLLRYRDGTLAIEVDDVAGGGTHTADYAKVARTFRFKP